MARLRPVVEVMMVDFIAVAMDAVLNQMAKLADFSGGWSRSTRSAPGSSSAGT